MKVVFLDRDGVINQEVNYLYEISEFRYTHRCTEALAALRKLGYELVVVTNQAGIAKGYYEPSQYHSLTDWYLNDLSERGIDILDVIHCPHHPEGVVPNFTFQCSCRKPKPGMLNQMADKHNIEMASSVMVGDKLSDVQAASAAGVGWRFLVKTGHPLPREVEPATCTFDDLYEVSEYLRSVEI